MNDDRNNFNGRTPGDQWAEEAYETKMRRRTKVSDAAREYIKALDNPKASEKAIDDIEERLVSTIEDEFGSYGDGSGMDFVP